jgi:hypothetical protein
LNLVLSLAFGLWLFGLKPDQGLEQGSDRVLSWAEQGEYSENSSESKRVSSVGWLATAFVACERVNTI